MNPTHKSLVAIATASALFVSSSMAHADGPSTSTQPVATTVAAPASATPAKTTQEDPAKLVVAKRSPLPIVTMAVGGAAALVGLCFYSLSSTNKTQANSADDLNRTYGEYGVDLDSKTLHDKSESEKQTGTILLAGGAAVAVGGLVWFFVDGLRVKSANESAKAKAKATSASTLRLTPAVGPGSTGAYLQGTF
jgi:hypothetical protein